MLAQAHTFTIQGPRARHVLVELDVRPGLPAFTIVGLADAAVREARERIQTAIRNCGLEFPSRRITTNLAPGELPKAGAGLDLAIACALLAATGQLEREPLRDVALFGELALDGRLRASHGTLAVAHAARECGLRRLAVARSSAWEASLIDGLEVAPIGSLSSAVRMLRGGPPDRLPPKPSSAATTEQPHSPAPALPDLADVRGQAHAVGALVVAAAGGHSIMLSGPPGTGKTMLARRLPSILPPLGRSEAIVAMLVASSTGAPLEDPPRERPFRAPHHTISAAGLVGGAGSTSIGEVVRAHRGVLFLDELSEFTRPTLEALRQPLEDGQVSIARAGYTSAYPSRFMLVAATNPCPCGYASEPDRCRCTAGERARHARRLSGPLLDRIDIHVSLALQRNGDHSSQATVSSTQAREQVAGARARQAARLESEGISLNAEMGAHLFRTHLHLGEGGRRVLAGAVDCGLLSARGEHRVLRVARTLADLDGSNEVRACDVGAALAYRCFGRQSDPGAP